VREGKRNREGTRNRDGTRNVVDLHPEDLLDKDARGELTAAEQERLDAHLARCATCRFEREVRADFAAELDGEPESLQPARIVEIALGHAPGASDAPRTAPTPTRAGDADEERASISPRRAGRRSFRIPLLVAAAVLVGGAAGAGASIPTLSRLVSHEEPEATARAHDAPPAPTETHAAPTPAPTPTELERVAPVEEPEPAPEPPPVFTPVRLAPLPLPLSLPDAPPPRIVAPVPDGPAALFDEAAAARRRGDHARAVELHRELVVRFPASREARVSHATIGQLLLDRGDPSGALASFDAYRAGGAGPLDEPVMVGRATALDRLGREREARAAWSALLEAFPRSPYVAHARARAGADADGAR
jgi:TolA-binding protein